MMIRGSTGTDSKCGLLFINYEMFDEFVIRFRLVPTVCRVLYDRFSNNASEMKKNGRPKLRRLIAGMGIQY